MNLPFPLLLDESVPADIAALMNASPTSVTSVASEDISGRDDSDVIERARLTGRVVVSQDSGFGHLALLQGIRCPGIIVLRPGHLKKEVILDTLERLFANLPAVESPFLLIVNRRGDEIHIRHRRL